MSPIKCTTNESACKRRALDCVVSASTEPQWLISVITQSLAQAVATSAAVGFVSESGISTKCQGDVPVGGAGVVKTCVQTALMAVPSDWKARSSSGQVEIWASVRLPRISCTGANWPDWVSNC